METLAAPEAPNLDSLPSERDEPVLLPVEEIRNPTGDNAEEESPFTVGDFVWAKAKGHPWWPAIISSPSESADRVMKTHRKTHSVPVAYFGDDDALAWCEPKQLKPFVEVFDEMSRQSRSMSFLAAVGCCMEEIGRCLEVGITCPCVSGEARGKLLLGDAGRKLPVTNYSPLEFLNCIREVARDVQVASPLDSVRLRSWVLLSERVSRRESLGYFNSVAGLWSWWTRSIWRKTKRPLKLEMGFGMPGSVSK
ncbi:hypothetical protein HPP92_021461 [Vanilla planifolia]|uniref:PWWP domain-containing protein n=1 Tax=Vanilla planifolia TaxID=51239 RepID=A0A835UJG3_VANPL|nr:hypothetical protein HPP92_021461 [Vanilla planifolia]